MKTTGIWNTKSVPNKLELYEPIYEKFQQKIISNLSKNNMIGLNY